MKRKFLRDVFFLPRRWLFQRQKEESRAVLLSGAKNCEKSREETEILSTERRTQWLAAISRADLTEKILENDRVCGIHFHSGKAAYLWDRFNPSTQFLACQNLVASVHVNVPSAESQISHV